MALPNSRAILLESFERRFRFWKQIWSTTYLRFFTYEHQENDKIYGYDKVIMLAGGVGMANKRDAIKAP